MRDWNLNAQRRITHSNQAAPLGRTYVAPLAVILVDIMLQNSTDYETETPQSSE